MPQLPGPHQRMLPPLPAFFPLTRKYYAEGRGKLRIYCLAGHISPPSPVLSPECWKHATASTALSLEMGRLFSSCTEQLSGQRREDQHDQE